MNRKGLAILLRTRMRSPSSEPAKLPLFPSTNDVNQALRHSEGDQSNEHGARRASQDGNGTASWNLNASCNTERDFELVQESMHLVISMNKTEILDAVLNDFSKGYFSLSSGNRRKLLLILARDYDLNRTEVRELIKQYLRLDLHSGEQTQAAGAEEEDLPSSFYRTERSLRHALKPTYEVLFERLNTHAEGLRFLSTLRAGVLAILAEENIASLRALDSYLKEKLITWLSPAALELHHITWDDPASLLEKIVAYEAVHPISSLLDLKRRLGVGRCCFGYFHQAIPGEPLIFIEVALLKTVAQTIQDVLWDDPPMPESQATCAFFYSISSTQPGLAGINLGKFLIKRVIELVKRDMPHISTFATLSPIPGFMQWLVSKLASQSKLAEVEATGISHSSEDASGSTFQEKILLPEEERAFLDLFVNFAAGKNGVEVMLNLLTSRSCEWAESAELLSVCKAPLMRLCARYLLHEKKRGKALDSVANFHLQNGAMVERINWMADRSEKGLRQSGGIMVNYVYRLENIEENAQSYFSTGYVPASCDLHCYIEQAKKSQATKKD